MHIREARAADLDDVLTVERLAFGKDSEAELVRNLLKDPTAEPYLSLLAFDEDRPVGHILFTKAGLAGPMSPPIASLLAPLAVVPEAQNRGIGGKLIERGLQLLSESGVDLVFVLGHPTYYPRSGFEPAGRLGFEAPYPIPEKDAGAWMVQALRQGVIGSVRGKVTIAEAVDREEYWRE